MTITLIDIRTAGGAGQLVQSTHKLDTQPDLLIVRWSDGAISTVAFDRPAAPALPAPTQP